MTPTIQQLVHTKKLAQATALGRLLAAPGKYLFAIGFRKLVYKFTKKPVTKLTTLFYGRKLLVPIPSSTDIYLTGGKSHPSELSLAAFFINTLQPGNQVLDIGAHCGYFSILAADLVAPTGHVYSFEPSDKAYSILAQNSASVTNCTIQKKAVSQKAGVLEFYEFPDLYSEYSTLEIDQFKDEAWFKEYQPKKITIPTACIDDIAQSTPFNFIKIDVEGAELDVIKGGQQFFKTHSPVIAMEYLCAERGNTGHDAAAALLSDLGYHSYIITEEGTLSPVTDVNAHLNTHSLESDNIVFRKATI